MKKQNSDKLFDDAIASGDEKSIRRLAKEGLKPPQGAMLFALMQDQPQLLKVLKEAGVNPNEPDGFGETPLGYAVTDCTPQVLEEILGLGADPALESLSIKPLTNAVLLGKKKHVLLLLKHGADPSELSNSNTPLIEALRTGQEEIACLLLEAGADPFMRGPNGLDAKSLASKARNIRLQKLIEKKAQPKQEAVPKGSRDHLLTAIRSGDRTEFASCLAHTEDINKQDTSGRTALDYAIEKGALFFVKLLIKAGANPNGIGDNFGGPLEGAVRQKRVDLARILLEAGADPNGCQASGGPLCAACEEGSYELAKCLLKSGAHVNGRTLRGQTPLMFAAQSQNLKLVNLLLDHGAEVNATDEEGHTALFHAIIANSYVINVSTSGRSTRRCLKNQSKKDSINLIERLLKAGARIDQKDKSGRRPIEYSPNSGISKVLESGKLSGTNFKGRRGRKT